MKIRILVFLAVLIIACNNDDEISSPDLKPVTASFDLEKDSIPAGELVSFINHSANANTYLWDFGDDSFSYSENPQHQYAQAGIYSVRLTASNEEGSDVFQKNVTITGTPFNIVPAQRIGNFLLDDICQVIVEKADDTTINASASQQANGTYLHFWEFTQTGIGAYFSTMSSDPPLNEKPFGIFAFKPFLGKTEKEITLGSSLAEVKAAYGTPDTVSSAGDLDYTNSLGIAFWADETQTLVKAIYITRL